MKETLKKTVLGMGPVLSYRYESTAMVRLPRMRVEIRPIPGRSEGFERVVYIREPNDGHRRRIA